MKLLQGCFVDYILGPVSWSIYKQFIWPPHPRACNIELAVRKALSLEMEPHDLKRLPLGLINSHGKAGSQRGTVGVPKIWSMSEIADFRVDSHGFKCVEFENDICFAI